VHLTLAFSEVGRAFPPHPFSLRETIRKGGGPQGPLDGLRSPYAHDSSTVSVRPVRPSIRRATMRR